MSEAHCAPCQFVINLAVALDRLANTLLLGDPTETISRRIARARDAGHTWARLACKALSAIFWTGDHCNFAETPGSITKELWHWSPGEQ